MAFDMFLKIDGIPGESVDSKHKGEIQLLSFSWGEQNTGAHAVGGGGGAGKVSMQDFHFAAAESIASPKLFLACASGQHIKTATLVARKAGDRSSLEFLKLELTDVLVSSFQSGGSEGETLPVDQVSLNFGRVQFSYTPQRPDGTGGTPVTAGWDIRANKAV